VLLFGNILAFLATYYIKKLQEEGNESDRPKNIKNKKREKTKKERKKGRLEEEEERRGTVRYQ